MNRVEATRNPDGKTWHLTWYRPGLPTLVCERAPWDLVERTTERCERASVPVPGPVSNGVSWLLMLIVLPGPLFWLVVELVNR